MRRSPMKPPIAPATARQQHRKTMGVPRLEKTQIVDLEAPGSEREEESALNETEDLFMKTYMITEPNEFDLTKFETERPTLQSARKSLCETTTTTSASRSPPAKKGNSIVVGVRVRPMNEVEKKDSRNKKQVYALILFYLCRCIYINQEKPQSKVGNNEKRAVQLKPQKTTLLRLCF